MTIYRHTENKSIPAEGGADIVQGERSAARNESAPPLLVSSPISQQTFEVYPKSIRVRRPFKGVAATPPDRSGSAIQGFSDKSKSRLRFIAANAGHLLQSQFCCTYQDLWPIDGREFKRHLNAFLVAARRAFPFLLNLWAGEFQTRGAPHAHVFLNVPATDENRLILARLWVRIAHPGNADMLAFHSHPRNMIPWKMGNGSYLCKYLDKEHQKAIPQGFANFGRWWGHSRGLVPDPDIITPVELREQFPSVDEQTGEVSDVDPCKYLIRTVGRYHEKINRRSWFRRTSRTATALTGAPIFRQALEYLRRQHNSQGDEPPPF